MLKKWENEEKFDVKESHESDLKLEQVNAEDEEYKKQQDAVIRTPIGEDVSEIELQFD